MKKKIVIIASVAVIVIAGVFAAVYFGLNEECRHDYERVVTKQATCLEAGTEQIVCAKCGDVKDEFSVSAFGHDLSEPTRTEPTHDSDGCISEKNA